MLARPNSQSSMRWHPTRRARILLGFVLAAGVAYWGLGLNLSGLLPKTGGLHLAGDFFSAAWHPAFGYESTGFVPAEAPSFLLKVLHGLWQTLEFAIAAISLAFAFGLVLGILAADCFWAERGSGWQVFRWLLRIVLAAMRSVHELLWALILLAAMGVNPATAVLAILIPYTGTLAKVFSEMLDEGDTRPADALKYLGATPLRVFLFARLPRSFPDITAYAFYRFECAVRSSAVLGFFGFPTVGLYLKQSFENLHYREVWSYLYGLILVVILLEFWSSLIRRRFVA